MEIVGYIAYASLVLLAIVWTMGVRTGPVAGMHEVLRAIYFVAAAVLIVALDLNMAHSLWVVPVGCFFSRIIAPALIKIPVVSMPFLFIADVFLRVVRTGMPAHKIKEAEAASMCDVVDKNECNGA